MLLPYLSEVRSASKKYGVVFRGLNYGEGTQDGEFAETHNLSTDQYPCITQRATRLMVGEYKEPTTLHAKGQLLVIDGTNVIYGGKKVGEVEAGKKQTATVGNYIIIFPDKKYYKTPTEEDKDGEFGDMEVECELKGATFTASSITGKVTYSSPWMEFTTSTISIGKEYKGDWLTFTRTASTVDRMSYISTTRGDFHFNAGDVVTISGVNGSTLAIDETKEFTIKEATSSTLSFDGNIFTAYTNEREYAETVTITKKVDNGFRFNAGDTVTISGCSIADNNKATGIIVREATLETLTFDDDTFTEGVEYGEVTIASVVQGGYPFGKGDSVTISGSSKDENNKTTEVLIKGVTADELIFDDNIFTEVIEDKDRVITIRRTVPDLDFICESGYRLWGTHGNTIYASAWGDPINFKSFEGIANDSYNIDIGSEGEFTGCIPYASHICFFKENTLHKLYGTKPSNYQVTTVNVYGVQSGSERSMQIVNEQLLYKGVGGVYAYTGGVPELVSEKFGNRRYSDAVAGCDGEKYYISMKDGDEWNLFAYDIARNIWLREDDTHAVDMAFYEGKVYFLDEKGGLYYIDKTAEDNDIEWSATFCTINETINERKGYSKFHLRMDLSAGAWLAVDIKTDNEPQWRQIYTTHNEKAKTVSIPIIPNRCDCIDIRLRGTGKCTIRTFIREFSVGSDV